MEFKHLIDMKFDMCFKNIKHMQFSHVNLFISKSCSLEL